MVLTAGVMVKRSQVPSFQDLQCSAWSLGENVKVEIRKVGGQIEKDLV